MSDGTMTLESGSHGEPSSGMLDSVGIDWVDVIASLVMALAALLTAWSAFQSDQWGDQMSFSLAQGSAARTEATREYTRAGQLTEVDVASFYAWLELLQNDVESGAVDVSSGYTPDPDTFSGFAYLRFRPDFAVAVDAWLQLQPLQNLDAPPTPFRMDEYRIPEAEEAERLEAEADAKYAEAQSADAYDDKYVLSTIVFAAVFLFAGLSTKMRSNLGQNLMLGFGVVVLIGAGIYVFTIPIYG